MDMLIAKIGSFEVKNVLALGGASDTEDDWTFVSKAKPGDWNAYLVSAEGDPAGAFMAMAAHESVDPAEQEDLAWQKHSTLDLPDDEILVLDPAALANHGDLQDYARALTWFNVPPARLKAAMGPRGFACQLPGVANHKADFGPPVLLVSFSGPTAETCALRVMWRNPSDD